MIIEFLDEETGKNVPQEFRGEPFIGDGFTILIEEDDELGRPSGEYSIRGGRRRRTDGMPYYTAVKPRV